MCKQCKKFEILLKSLTFKYLCFKLAGVNDESFLQFPFTHFLRLKIQNNYFEFPSLSLNPSVTTLRNEIPELFTFQNLIGRAIATMLANVRALSEISTCLHLSHWPCTSLRRNSAEKRSQVIQSAARDPRCLGNGEWTTSQEGWGGELSKQHVAG